MSSAGSETTIEAVMSRLSACLEELADRTCERIYADLDSYARIEPAALAAAVARNLGTALDALHVGHAPDPSQLDGAAQTASERYASGVPVEEIVRGFRISIALIHELFLDIAVSEGLPVEQTLNGSRVVWSVGDAFTTRIITKYHELALASALHNARRRSATVNSLLAGELPRDATLAGVDPHAHYAAIRCDVDTPADVERVRALLESSGSSPAAAALVVAEEGVCLGVVATRPRDPGVPVGVGPFVPPDDLPRSDRVARQALWLAHKLQRDGVQDTGTLGWRMAAASRPDVWRSYADQFLAPLQAEGDFGRELRTAVLAWLHHQQSVNRAAAAINVHANTLRYRLRRYCDVTGADLADLDDVIGVAWALELEHPQPDTL